MPQNIFLTCVLSMLLRFSGCIFPRRYFQVVSFKTRVLFAAFSPRRVKPRPRAFDRLGGYCCGFSRTESYEISLLCYKGCPQKMYFQNCFGKSILTNPYRLHEHAKLHSHLRKPVWIDSTTLKVRFFGTTCIVLILYCLVVWMFLASQPWSYTPYLTFIQFLCCCVLYCII